MANSGDQFCPKVVAALERHVPRGARDPRRGAAHRRRELTARLTRRAVSRDELLVELLLVLVVDETADLAARPARCVDVDVGMAGLHRPHDLRERPRLDALAVWPDDICRGDIALDRARDVGAWIRMGAAAAEEEHHASVVGRLAEVDVREERVSTLQPGIPEHEVDGRLVHELGVEVPVPRRRDRRNLQEPVQAGFELLVVRQMSRGLEVVELCSKRKGPRTRAPRA